MGPFREAASEILLKVKAMPGSGRSALGELRGDELVVRLTAQPEKGKANRELLELLARAAGVPRSSLRIVSGETSRHKVVAFPSNTLARLRDLLGA